MTSHELEAERQRGRELLDAIFADLADLKAQLLRMHCITCAVLIVVAMIRAVAFVFGVSAWLGVLTVRSWGRRVLRRA